MVNGYASNHLGSFKNKSHAKAAQIDIIQINLMSSPRCKGTVVNERRELFCPLGQYEVLFDRTKSCEAGLHSIGRKNG
jgi:hypothetical protein